MKIIAIVIIALGFIMQYFLVFGADRGNHVLMFILKTLASLCFASAGIIAYVIGSHTNVSLLIAIGLVCGMIGDILLHLRFVIFEKVCMLLGIAAFMSGHVIYIIAMFCGASKWYVGLIFAAVLLPVARKYIFMHETDFGKMLPLGNIYMAVELFFSGLALSRMIVSLSPSTVLFFIGSISFVFSDIMWILQNFTVIKKPIYRTLCLVPYYLAQNIFVISLLL